MTAGTAFMLLFVVDGSFHSMPSTAPSLAHRCRSGPSTSSEDFEVHGEPVIARVREENPAAYLKVVASLVPKQLGVDVSVSGITEQLARVRQHQHLRKGGAEAV